MHGCAEVLRKLSAADGGRHEDDLVGSTGAIRLRLRQDRGGGAGTTSTTAHPMSRRYLDVSGVGVEELSDDQQEEVHYIRPLVNLGHTVAVDYRP